MEALQEIGLVLAGIDEALRNKQHTRLRGVQEHELSNGIAKVDRQLLVTSKGEETPRLFNDTKDRIKQIEGAIVEAINERRGA